MSRGKKLEQMFDRNDVYPWPWLFADEVLAKRYGLTLVEEYRDGHIYHYTDIGKLEAVSYPILNRALRDPQYYPTVSRALRAHSRVLLSFSKICGKKRHEFLSDKELVNDVVKYVRLLKKLREWGWIPVLIEGVTTPIASVRAMEMLRSDLPDQEESALNQIFSTLTTPDSASTVQKSRTEMYHLASALGNRLSGFVRAKNPDEYIEALPMTLRRSVRTYLSIFAWTTFNYEGPTLNASLLQKSLKGMTGARARAELSAITQRASESSKKKKGLLKDLTLSRETRRLLSLLAESMLMKDYRKSVYQQSYTQIEPHLSEIARRVGVHIDECKFLSLEEMRYALAKAGKYRARARKRRAQCVVLVTPKKTQWYEGVAAKKILKQMVVERAAVAETTLRGQVAYPGTAQGIVRLVFTVKDIAKMKKGDILVSSATNPDLLPAMKIAGAIVTDIGGIISHAAITSREMHIPCVVGTKIATKVLKDGDRVRVDAKEGIVRRID